MPQCARLSRMLASRSVTDLLLVGRGGGGAGLRFLHALTAEFFALLALQCLGVRLLGAFERLRRALLRRLLVGGGGGSCGLGVGLGSRRGGLREGGAGGEQGGQGDDGE